MAAVEPSMHLTSLSLWRGGLDVDLQFAADDRGFTPEASTSTTGADGKTRANGTRLEQR